MSFKWNPLTGTLDFFQKTNTATSLQVNRIANVQIFAGECVKSDSITNVSLATNDGLSSDAIVLGIAANDANVGENVVVVIMGVITNTAYNIFSLNSVLFLDQNGGITDVRPVFPAANFLTPIGKSLGGGSIFAQIELPTQLS